MTSEICVKEFQDLKMTLEISSLEFSFLQDNLQAILEANTLLTLDRYLLKTLELSILEIFQTSL